MIRALLWWGNVIHAPNRDTLMKYLRKEGIGCSILYGKIPIYSQEYSRKLYGANYNPNDIPVTEKLKKVEFNLPEPRYRSQCELEYIAKKLKVFYS